MIEARIRGGRVEVQEPIPEAWEGQLVRITPLTPDEAMADLEERLAALHALGPMEFGRGEREKMAQMLNELNEASKQAIARIGADPPQ